MTIKLIELFLAVNFLVMESKPRKLTARKSSINLIVIPLMIDQNYEKFHFFIHVKKLK
jgi:hypothetical protein